MVSGAGLRQLRGRTVYSLSRLLLIFALLGVGCINLPPFGAAERDLIFADDFDGGLAGSWRLEGDAQGSSAIVDGRLLLTVSAPATVQYATLEDQIFTDFIVDVDATQIGGTVGSSYGILIRMAAPGQFYRFEVTSNGEYTVERHDGDGAWERLTDGWQESEAIVRGVNQINKLRVAAVAGRFSFYANETLLVQVFDNAYPTGAIAVDAGTFNQIELQVAFDNFAVTAP